MKFSLATVTEPFIKGLNRVAARRGKRLLVHEILSIQILSATIIGALAIASLYWGGQWVLQDNYGRWALQWTEELNELGSPLYMVNDGEALIRLESFVDKYPEIGRVTYFEKDGTAVFSIDKQGDNKAVESLSSSLLQEAKTLVGNKQPYLMRSGVIEPRQFEILAPVWTESISEDGLFDFDPSAPALPGNTELIGFVGIHLDFLIFHDRLLANIKIAILFLLALLVVFGFYSRRALRKALVSISDLQKPIRELAKGNLEVRFQPAKHREISDIVEALETTVSALSERDAKLLRLANHDNLTGLFNRRRFMEELELELESVVDNDHISALIFIDLDQFKYINDTCGHPAGDRLIRKVADELLRCAGRNDIVARFGGDEFVVLVCDTDKTATQSLAEEILVNMRRLAHIEDDQVFHVHCSIGISMVEGSELNHDDLMAQADIACREAKSAGRNRMHFYKISKQKAQRASSDAGWMNRLRKAVDEDEFELRFQPINRIDTGQTTHHEVLLRFRSDDGQLISPDAFLPAAVRFGLMSEIDLWMIRHAAEAFAEHSMDHPRLQLSINLSANAFETDELASFVAETFKNFEVPPDQIMFEITESLAVRRPRHVDRQISALRDLGCQLALDDFGTGYSSLSYLQQLHFDYIKIDGTFVEDILNNSVDQKMIKLIAEIGREAKMQTIAEYVQSAEALSLLGELGVDMAQGYFVGRPAKRPQLKSLPISLSSQRIRRSMRK